MTAGPFGGEVMIEHKLQNRLRCSPNQHTSAHLKRFSKQRHQIYCGRLGRRTLGLKKTEKGHLGEGERPGVSERKL
jgi:hypothetical protein